MGNFHFISQVHISLNCHLLRTSTTCSCPFRQGGMLPDQLGQASGVAIVCSQGTSQLLAQEPPSCLREGSTPSAHTSVMGERGSSCITRPSACCWSRRVCWDGCKQTAGSSPAGPVPQAHGGAWSRERGQTQIKTR